MRKILLTTIVFFGLLSAVSAQRVFHAGLLGGVSISQVLNDGLSHYSKLGFYGGGFISTSEDLIKFGNEVIYPKLISETALTIWIKDRLGLRLPSGLPK